MVSKYWPRIDNIGYVLHADSLSCPGHFYQNTPCCIICKVQLKVIYNKFYHIYWRRKWQPIPGFLPGESHGQRSLAGHSPRGRKVSDMIEYTQTYTIHLCCYDSGMCFPLPKQWHPREPVVPQGFTLCAQRLYLTLKCKASSCHWQAWVNEFIKLFALERWVW